MDKRNQTAKYVAGDLVSSISCWILYWWLILDGRLAGDNHVFVFGLVLFPSFWLLFNFVRGFYHDPFRRSRLKELAKSFSTTLFGSLIITVILVNAEVVDGNINSFIWACTNLIVIYMPVTYIPRVVITSLTISSIRQGRIGFNTLVIGSDVKAAEICKEMWTQIRPTGNKFVGFININGSGPFPMSDILPHLGGLNALREVISNYRVMEVIIALESTEHDKIDRVLNMLDQPGLVVRAIPAMHDILTGRVRVNTIMETPLIQLSRQLMPPWQYNVKQVMDIMVSLIALVILTPLSIGIMLWIKSTSRGPVIYSHERIGKNGKPFRIYKFRTMVDNAEKNGPELSSDDDERITSPGRFLRKTRLDEIPNFINVLKGEMSLVGPRPERRYYIDQILTKAPHYKHLLKIKPGITSWGQVKYGYASNVDEMVHRLKYDIIYLENMSVFVDIQIMILTLLIIFKRKGV